MGLLKNINRPEVAAVYFTFQSNLYHFIAGDDLAEKMPVINQGEWSEAYINRQKFSFTEKGSETPHGRVYDYTLSLFIPGDFSSLSSALADLTADQHLVMVIFEDDSRLCLGDEFAGADFTYQQSINEKGADCTWSFASLKPAIPIQWIEQFFIHEGIQYQRFDDGNEYTITDQVLFIQGPSADDLTYNQGTLV